jgi:hypothetical protein
MAGRVTHRPPLTVATAPIELAGDWGHMLPASGLVSDCQPTRLRVDEPISGPPAIWLHPDGSTMAWIIVELPGIIAGYFKTLMMAQNMEARVAYLLQFPIFLQQQGSQVDGDRDETLPKHGGAIRSTIEPPLDLGPDSLRAIFLFLQQMVPADFLLSGAVVQAMSLAPALVAARRRRHPRQPKKALGLKAQSSKLSPGTKAKLSSAKVATNKTMSMS